MAEASSRLRLLRLAVVAVVSGALLGGANSLSNVLGSPYSPRSLSQNGIFVLEVLAAVLGTAWAWALTAFGAGWWARRIWAGPVVGVAALLIADVTYYLSDSLTGYAEFSNGELLAWGILAVPTGLVMGLLGALAVQRRRWSIVPGLMGPAAVALLAARIGSDHIQPWPTVLTWTIAATLTVAVGASWVRTMARSTPTEAAPGTDRHG
jgi:hypothetical protein